MIYDLMSVIDAKSGKYFNLKLVPSWFRLLADVSCADTVVLPSASMWEATSLCGTRLAWTFLVEIAAFHGIPLDYHGRDTTGGL